MATKRKTTARASSGARTKSASKKTAARKATSSRPSPAKRAASKPARPAAKVGAKSAKPAKPAAKSMKSAKPASKVAKTVAKPAAKSAKPAGKGVLKPVPGKGAVKGGKPVPGKKAGKSHEPPVVRPLGVLPPQSRAKSPERPRLPVRPLVKPVRTPAPRVQTQGAQPVTEKDLKEFEQRLLTERGKIMKEMGHLENTVLKQNQRDSSGDLSGYAFHMADAGTDAYEREKAFLFASAEGRALLEVDEALRRVYRGEYGMCESCGNPIAKARLEAMPYARLCVSCKEKEEKAAKSQQ